MKQTAQGLAALGRGPDTQLVHMAPSEVESLQRLAMAHGGSLTINPQTGLPEAGFLSSIMPMVIGAGLMAATGGTAAPLIAGMSNAATIGLGIGGVQALRTGSLSQGLMAGLGAYGGAGLAGGLMGAGTGALSSAAGAGMEIPAGAVVPEVIAPATDFAAGNVNAGLTAANEAQLVAANAANVPAYYGPSVGAEAANVGLPQTVTQAPVLAAPVAPTGPVPTMSPTGDFARFDRAFSPGLGASSTEQLSAGLQSATASPGAALDFAKANKYPLGAIGISALGGMQPESGGVGPAQTPSLIRPYTYSREKIPSAFQDVVGEPYSSKERQYFADQYTAGKPYKAPGEEYMATGGPVEDMSNANAIGASTGYPQSDIRTGAYSSPFQRPTSQNVVTGAQDAAVDPYTGQATFADGGYVYNPNTFLFSRESEPSAAYENGSIGGFVYNPATGQYTKLQPIVAAQAASPAQATNPYAVDGGGGSPMMDSPSQGYVTGVSSSTTGYGNPGEFSYSSSESGVGNPGESQGQTSSESGVGNPGESAGDGSTSGTSDSSGDGTGGEARGGLNLNGRYYPPKYAHGGMARYATGGISDLGSYSDGGRLLRGPGDGVSDSIPAVIGKKRPARLADGEFVVPARIVSELGNGSTEAGARKLYAMMERVQKSRSKTVGKGKVAVDNKSSKHLPA